MEEQGECKNNMKEEKEREDNKKRR